MHDRAVRRRRAVLVVLVAASLFLLTAYFGESSSGSLHSVQRGVMGVLSPIQDGASRVLKPFRDLFGWFGDTFDAKGQRDAYKRQAEDYRTQLGQAMVRIGELQQRSQLKDLDQRGLDQYQPVEARVIVRSPNAFYQRVEINKGTGDAIQAGDPVVAGGGLIGKVETALGSSSVVTLITDQDFAVGALAGPSREPGNVQPAIGAPGDLLLKMVQDATKIRTGNLVYTAGTVSSRADLASRYPPGIVIGRISRIDAGSGDLDRRIHVTPVADIPHTDVVQVLTNPHADLRAATG
jgi:rod shape-determining protein MreC